MGLANDKPLREDTPLCSEIRVSKWWTNILINNITGYKGRGAHDLYNKKNRYRKVVNVAVVKKACGCGYSIHHYSEANKIMCASDDVSSLLGVPR